MGHHISGFVGRPETLRALSARFRVAKLFDLDAGFAIVPATDELCEAIEAAYRTDDRPAAANALVAVGAALTLPDLSRHGPVAFVETDYFGGMGGQSAVACVHGEVVPAVPGSEWPINDALRAIGVVCAGGQDEFDTVGLRAYRGMDDFE